MGTGTYMWLVWSATILLFQSSQWTDASYENVTWSFLNNSAAGKSVLKSSVENATSKYEASWDSLDRRPLPSWYDDAKFGVFVHWGVYSVPAFASEWFWQHLDGDTKPEYRKFMKKMYPGKSYQDLAPMLTGSYFNAKEWARIVENSGARYFVFTSKHHEGFTFWKSDQSWNWNSVDIGPKRNVLGELKEAFEKTKVTFGLYFSLYEWFNPLYKKDKENKFSTQEFVETKITKQLHDLINTYQPLYLWSDGDWETNSSYWNSTNFLAWLYNESPVKDKVVVNDRWGTDANCKHGDVKNCEDRYNPGRHVSYKWENAMTIDKKSWGYRKESTMKDYIPTKDLIDTLIQTVSCGGNLLLNVGPTSDGRILPIFEERLSQIGDWLRVNGEGIYGTRPWRVQRDSSKGKVWYTKKDSTVYAHLSKWPKRSELILAAPKTTNSTKITMLGNDEELKWSNIKNDVGLKVDLSPLPVAELADQHAWTFKLDDVR